MQTDPMITVQRSGATLILAPEGEVGAFADAGIECEVRDLLLLLDEPGVQNLVIDFQAAPYFGSTMISAMVRLGKCVRHRGGLMALCNVSPEALDVLRVTNLHDYWPICSSLSDALATIRH